MSLDLIGTLLSTVLASRPRRSRNALGYLAGTLGSRALGGRGLAGGSLGGLLNPSTIMTAAGLAWGVYETMQQQHATASPPPAAPAGAPPPTFPDAGGRTSTQGAIVPPPLPVSAAGPSPAATDATAAAIDPRVLRLLRLALASANADGLMKPEERAAIDAQAAAAGVPAALLQQLGARMSLADIVAGVDDRDERTALYVLAFTIVRTDEQVSGAERIFLARLASLLALDPSTVEVLEREAAAGLDAADSEMR